MTSTVVLESGQRKVIYALICKETKRKVHAETMYANKVGVTFRALHLHRAKFCKPCNSLDLFLCDSVVH